MKEVWKDIAGYENHYLVSNAGRVKSVKRFVRKSRDMVMKPNTDNAGYKTVGLLLNGVCKTIKIHRLVALAFIDNPENKPMVNHINEIKSDNRLENLEWSTCKENIRHSFYKRPLDIAHLSEMSKNNRKKIYQYSSDGRYLRSHKSTVDAAAYVGAASKKVGKTVIWRALAGQRMSAYGSIWKYEKT